MKSHTLFPARSRRSESDRRSRWFRASVALLSLASLPLVASRSLAADTPSTVTTGTDLTLGATYGGTLPGATSDVIFNTGYPTVATAFTLNSSLAIGTLNDANANAITIDNNGATSSTLTLSTAANAFAPAQTTPVGTAADLIYVGANSSLTLQGANGGAGAGTLSLALGANGNFDVGSGGTLNISTTVTGTARNIVNTGAGTINYSGATSAAPSGFVKFTINGGATVTSSGFLNASGSNVGVADGSAGTLNVTGGVFNAAVGANTFFDGNGATGQITVSGGQFNILNAVGSTTGAAAIYIGGTYNGSGGNNGNGAITLTGGVFSTSTTTGTFQLGSTTGGTGTGTINLNGGTLSTNRAFTKGTGGAAAINFNGGTLQATGTALAIPNTITTPVQDNGGTIDSNGFAISLAANFAHGGTAATDGGLTIKAGAGSTTLSGTLSFTGGLTTNTFTTLSANNSYTGATQVNAGELYANGTGILPLSTSAVTVANGANVTVGNHAGGTFQTMTNNFTLNGAGTSVSAATTSGTLAAGALAFYNSGGFSLTGTVNLATTSIIYDNPVTQTGNITFTNTISGAGGLVLAAANSNGTATNLALSGVNTYGTTNATTQFSNFNGGGTMTVTLSTNNNVLPTNTVLTLGGTPTGQGGSYNAFVNVALNGVNQTVAGLTTSGSGTYRIIGNSTTLSTFTVNDAANYTFGGIFGSTGTNNNNLALVKSGAGTLTLSGANTYAGGTTVNAGTLTVTGALGATTGPLAVNNANTGVGTAVVLNLPTTATTVGSLSGTVAAPASGTNTATINTSATVANAFTVNQTTAGTFGGTIAGAAGFTLGALSTNTLTLSGANTYTGATNIGAGGTLALANAGTNSGTVVAGGTLTATPSVAVSATGTLLLSANNTVNPAATVSLGGGAITAANGVLQGQGATPTDATTPQSTIAGFGALTLTASSTLNYGATGTLVFTGFTPGTFALNVTGNAFDTTGTGGTDGTNDRLIFTTTQASNLGSITFNGAADATQVTLSDGTFEVEPNLAAVPEPATWLAGLLTVASCGFSQRRRLRGIVAGLRRAA